MAAWEDREELGRRIRAMRSYLDMTQSKFAKRIGTTDKTLGAMEHGEVTDRTRSAEDRRRLAEQIYEEMFELPLAMRSLLGVTELPRDDAELIREEVRHLGHALQDLARRTLEEDEELDFLRYLTNVPRSEEQVPEAPNA